MTTRKIIVGGKINSGPAISAHKVVAGRAGDTALAVVGCCLALGSAAFGIGMMVHGPLAGFGKGGGFTVFAQLAPRTETHARSAALDPDLDLTATASIPRENREAPADTRAATPSVTLEAASAGSAVIAIDGQTAVVHVGDEIPGMGAVVAIRPGPKPEVRTAHGLILAAAR